MLRTQGGGNNAVHFRRWYKCWYRHEPSFPTPTVLTLTFVSLIRMLTDLPTRRTSVATALHPNPSTGFPFLPQSASDQKLTLLTKGTSDVPFDTHEESTHLPYKYDLACQHVFAETNALTGISNVPSSRPLYWLTPFFHSLLQSESRRT